MFERGASVALALCQAVCVLSVSHSLCLRTRLDKGMMSGLQLMELKLGEVISSPKTKNCTSLCHTSRLSFLTLTLLLKIWIHFVRASNGSLVETTFIPLAVENYAEL